MGGSYFEGFNKIDFFQTEDKVGRDILLKETVFYK